MTSAVYAAGAVCWRYSDGKLLILVVHRTKYADITIPKGKVEPGELLPQTAQREILEETGLAVSLGIPLGMSSYQLDNGKSKIVHYWAAEVSEKAISRSTFLPNSEIAALEWVSLKKARKYLTYDHDVEIIDGFEKQIENGINSTFALIMLRHAKALPKNTADSDANRPLSEHGVAQATAAADILHSWKPKRIITSDALRCITTVAPLAAKLGIVPHKKSGLSQNAHEEGIGTVREIIAKRIRSGKTSVLCTHAPVLPEVIKEIALATATLPGYYLKESSALDTAGFSVVHLSANNPGSGIISIETYETTI